MIASEKIVCCSQFSREEGMPGHGRPHGEVPGSIKRRKRGRRRARGFIVVSMEGTSSQDNRLKIA